MPELPISGCTSQKQVTLHHSELCVRHAQCARKLVCALNTSRLTEQIRGSEILNCLCHFLCRSSTHRTDFFLPSGKFGIPYSKWKGLFSKSASWSFSVVPWTCQAFALCHTWLSQVPKATHGYMARKKTSEYFTSWRNAVFSEGYLWSKLYHSLKSHALSCFVLFLLSESGPS